MSLFQNLQSESELLAPGTLPGLNEARSVFIRDPLEALAQDWRKAGLGEGDIVLFHSRSNRTIRRLLKMGLSPDADLVIDSLLLAIGRKGTLLFPLFNFDFADGLGFDIRSSPSRMGTLTEAARTRPGAVRTGHPIYSFAVLGARREEFAGLENFSGYGADSPFGILHRSGGKIAVLDLEDQESMTFYHYVEESKQVDYRFHKEFTGPYTDARGMTRTRTFGLFVRDLERGVVTDVERMARALWQEGIYTGDRAGYGNGLRVAPACGFFDRVARCIDAGQARNYLYSINMAAALG